MEKKNPKATRLMDLAVDPTHIEEVDCAIVHCIDPRFTSKLCVTPDDRQVSMIESLAEKCGWKTVVQLTEAGGAKVLGSTNQIDRAARQSLLTRIAQELQLHNPKNIVLTVHQDCGGYGYSGAFKDHEAERRQLIGDLAAAVHAFRGTFTGKTTPIRCFILHKDGVDEVGDVASWTSSQ